MKRFYASEAEFLENTPSVGKLQACSLPRMRPIGTCRCLIGHQKRSNRTPTILAVLLGIAALAFAALGRN